MKARPSSYFRGMKRVLQLLAAAGVLAAAAAWAWQMAGDGSRHQVKEAAKRMLGRSPKRIGGQPPAVAAIVQGATGILTGDPAPFTYASGLWSAVTYGSDGSAVHPNLQFDFEVPESGDQKGLSEAWARSGNRSYRMEAGEEYSPAIRRRAGDVATKLVNVDVGLWAWSSSPRTLLTAVVTLDRDQKQLAWFGKDLQADTSARSGQRLNAGFRMEHLDVQPGDVVSVYLWKRGGAEAFIDDMDLFFHSAEVPGRAQGEPVRLDAADPALPQYADMAVIPAAVDSSRFRPGMPAASTTLGAVPFGQGPMAWRFVPAQGLAFLQGPDGEDLALIRPFVDGKDATHYDRVFAETDGTGVRLTSFDVERDGEMERIAAVPAPWSVQLELRRP